ncbi:ferredoxin--NADP(+) reductase [Methylopila jiangsuensis]|uniref:Ferredoxin--NADP(+) reductase n=1 Tax=Methylopila jiangsuensis TaxID=586230 RepID=A0A9W6JGG6_9HYPH|nr:PDR/VanB family oxidoreductase [Methylopila jiangsuensis]MDR6286499.1 ferredoxin-NADP reductase [Methylopila jiangsuensis]GLK77160.1 ferredoxin--NADP(+) reductase [Methylopila jiangsuensis]
MSGGIEIPVRVVEIEQATATVKRFRFAPVSGEPLPPFSSGAHVVVLMPAADRTIRNAYSLIDRAEDGSSYRIGVLRTPQSRGGSAFMHEQVTVGTELKITMPVNLFPLVHAGRKHLLIAGGIGITPIFAMAEELRRTDASYEIHYAMRNTSSGAFVDELRARHGDKLKLYRDDFQETLAVDAILPNQPLGAHLYVCGPAGMIEAILEGGREAGWPEENLHSERFQAPPTGEPFSVRLAKAGIACEVRGDQSLLEALEQAGVDAPFLCRGGACGQCEAAVIEADGELVHNDHYLTEADRASGAKIMLCVSRLKGRELVLDL